MMYVEVIGGFLLLLGAAEVMLRGAVGLARAAGLSTLFIGMTVVALGTSAPEMVVSLNAAMKGAPTIALGNVVGSNIANVLLVLGAAALLAPMVRRTEAMVRDAALLTACTALFVMLCWPGELDFVGGALLLIIFIAFMASSYWRDINNPAATAERTEEVEEIGHVPTTPWIAVAATVGGLVGIVLGADLLVEGGVTIARSFGVPEEVIGLTLIAIGTSLPELAASVVAALRGHTDVALGNIVGSNLFNMLAIAGVVSMAVPLPIPDTMLSFDVWVMFAATVLLVPTMLGMMGVARISGGLFLALYVGYLAAQVMGVPQRVADWMF